MLPTGASSGLNRLVASAGPLILQNPHCPLPPRSGIVPTERTTNSTISESSYLSRMLLSCAIGTRRENRDGSPGMAAAGMSVVGIPAFPSVQSEMIRPAPPIMPCLDDRAAVTHVRTLTLRRAAARLGSLLVLFGLLFPQPGAVAAADPPNIVVILADDLGYSDLACYGGEIATRNWMPWRRAACASPSSTTPPAAGLRARP